MTQTIFVSSTFIDLEAHRRLVRDAIARLELTFKAMEFFGALPDTPKAECLRLGPVNTTADHQRRARS